MAIPFLNNIDLSDNQLLNAKLQITGTAPAAEQGQIYFNSAAGFLKPRVYDGAAWLNILDTTSVISGTYVSSTVTSNVDLTLDLSAVDGTSTAASRFLTKDNEWATIPFGDVTEVQGGTNINVTDQTGPIPIVNLDDSITLAGTATATTFLGDLSGTINTITTGFTQTPADNSTKIATTAYADAAAAAVPIGDYLPLAAGSGSPLTGDLYITKNTPKLIINDTVASDLKLEISQQGSTTSFTSRGGTSSTGQFNFRITNGSTITNALFINQQARATFAGDVVVTSGDVTLGGELTVSGNGQSSVAGQLTIPQVPANDTDAASKHYVDQAVTGALSYQGAYNAATNTPDLDSSPSSDIKTGWTYTVTVEGLFFTEQVRVGDVLIANNNAPTTLAEWTTVQNNIDLADASTVGIGNVVPGASNTITAPYTNGTATLDVVDSTAAQKGAVIVSAGTGISVAYVAGEATVTNTETNANNSKTGTITAGNLSGTVTHAFGINTIVQTISSSGDTVYCDVTRTATTSVATIAAVEATDITILVQKIG